MPNLPTLNATVSQLLAPGKGLLAADESFGTIKARFDAIGVASTEETRRDYREFLFRSREPMSRYVSGVILFDETIWQDASDGTPMVDLITAAGAVPGIKVDHGTVLLPGFEGESITEGLDGLAQRLDAYRERGARFAKWRAVIDMDEGLPTPGAIRANAQALARYAALCQAHDIVPIVEPEVLMDADPDISRREEVTRFVLQTTFQELFEQRVALEGMILKPNMVLTASPSAEAAAIQDVAQRTLRVLKATVPAAVPGVAFLSGGQADTVATAHLDAMNRMGPLPWTLTFSYGRALQTAAQRAWAGLADNVARAQGAFAHRARMNSLASRGDWTLALETAA
ncbi:MAG: fructose-bisphosphate aldolase class I [Pseudoalteromonas distincta]|jgi:fructose-bisphosphate aldolase class I